MWSQIKRCKLILMSDSKYDDAKRILWKEKLKAFLIQHYSAALCSGDPQREYLIRLGFPKERIFLGYDAVDNEYFYNNAERVRNNPNYVRHLPGLNDL